MPPLTGQSINLHVKRLLHPLGLIFVYLQDKKCFLRGIEAKEAISGHGLESLPKIREFRGFLISQEGDLAALVFRPGSMRVVLLTLSRRFPHLKKITGLDIALAPCKKNQPAIGSRGWFMSILGKINPQSFQPRVMQGFARLMIWFLTTKPCSKPRTYFPELGELRDRQVANERATKQI